MAITEWYFHYLQWWTAWQWRLLTNLMLWFWGVRFFCPVTWGSDHPVAASAGSRSKVNMTHFLQSSCDYSGSIWWSVIIHNRKLWGCFRGIGGQRRFYGVSEIKTYSDWTYKNQMGLMVTGSREDLQVKISFLEPLNVEIDVTWKRFFF